jgi:putative DNA primase/helicase
VEEYHSTGQDKPPNGTDCRQIPEELRRLPQWMGTRFEVRSDGRVDKPPRRIHWPTIKANKTDPANWATFEGARAALERGEVDAIGLVFTKDDPLFCVDLDKVVAPETGEIQPNAAELVHTLGSYAELSCSGKGVHVIGIGQKPGFSQCRTDSLGFEVEIYDRRRFLVMTGRTIGAHEAPQQRQDALEALCRRLWPRPESREGPKGPPNAGSVDLEDCVLLERARTSRSGPKFHKLYDLGDTSGHKSASEADFALLNMLVFWTAGDHERIIRLFEASALHRKKGKHHSYVGRSAANALSNYKGTFYRPRSVEKVREQEEADPLAPWLSLMLTPRYWTGRRGASAYKAFVAAVIRASEDGVIDDDGDLRIGTDIRSLAEVAGTSFQTLSRSALPYLMKDMKLLKWKRGKGKKAGVLVLQNPTRISANTKVSTHFSVQSCAPPPKRPKNAPPPDPHEVRLC